MFTYQDRQTDTHTLVGILCFHSLPLSFWLMSIFFVLRLTVCVCSHRACTRWWPVVKSWIAPCSPYTSCLHRSVTSNAPWMLWRPSASNLTSPVLRNTPTARIQHQAHVEPGLNTVTPPPLQVAHTYTAAKIPSAPEHWGRRDQANGMIGSRASPVACSLYGDYHVCIVGSQKN